MVKIDPKYPIYTVSEVMQIFDFSNRAILEWCKRGYIDGAFRSPGGHWRIPEAGLRHIMETMAFRQDEIEYALKEFKDAQ